MSLPWLLSLFLAGVAVLLVAHGPWVPHESLTARFLETIGTGLAAYAPLQLLALFAQYLRRRRFASKARSAFTGHVQIVDAERDRPLLFAIDISGCITPARDPINLARVSRLRTYCDWLRTHREYPQICLYTGRGQGYVELMSQILGTIDLAHDIPHVIENGSALYQPTSKRTISLLDDDQQRTALVVRNTLCAALPNNEFEPKVSMTTINARPDQTTEELREEVALLLKERGLHDRVHISSTITSVDVTPRGIRKLDALKRVLRYFPDGEKPDLKHVAGIGDQLSDLDILRSVGRPYCPSNRVHQEVREYVERKAGPAHVVEGEDVDFVVRVIERECGIRIYP